MRVNRPHVPVQVSVQQPDGESKTLFADSAFLGVVSLALALGEMLRTITYRADGDWPASLQQQYVPRPKNRPGSEGFGI